jgi:hypothetical protein
MTVWSILLLLEKIYGHLVYFVDIWYIFPRFGILYRETSGNPAPYALALRYEINGCQQNSATRKVWEKMPKCSIKHALLGMIYLKNDCKYFFKI